MDWYFRALVSLAAGALAVPLGRGLVARAAWARRPAAARFVFGLGFLVMLWGGLYTVFALVTTPRARAPGGHADHADQEH
jgi:hypothetical protein